MDKTYKMDKTNTPPLPIKDKEPKLITLKAVDWNAARLWQRIQNGGDRMYE
jgi:hypothetical protein